MEVLSQEVILNNLPADVIIPLCGVSSNFRRRCADYLQNRIIGELGDPSIILNPQSPIRDFIRIMSLDDEDFVVRGSEDFIGSDEALYRAVKTRNERLIDYLDGELRFLALISLLEGDLDAVRRILIECDFDDDFDEMLAFVASKVGASNLGLPNVSPSSPESLAKTYDSSSMVKRLLEISDVDLETLIEEAASGGNLNVIRYLASYPEADLGSGIVHAASEGHIKVVKYLFDRVSSVFLEEALNSAAKEGYLDVIKYIIQTPDIRFTQWTLALAASGGYDHIIDYLIGIRPELDSPLRDAMRKGALDTIKYLTGRGYTSESILANAERMALSRDLPEVIGYLIDRGVDPQDVLENAIRKGSINVIRYLIDNFEIDAGIALERTADGNIEAIDYIVDRDLSLLLPVLQNSAYQGNLRTVRHLIERYDADPQIPLDSAASGGNPDIVKYLLNTYPDLNPQTALNSAATEGRLATVRYLIGRYPELSLEDAYVQAAKNKHQNVMKFLPI